MNKEEHVNEVKQQITKRLFNVLQGQAQIIREDTQISNEDKLIQLDIVLDLHRFLAEHDKAVEILNREKQKERGFNYDER